MFCLITSHHNVSNNQMYSGYITSDLLQTVDYVMADGTVVFRTCQEEKDKVVFQMVCVTCYIALC